MLGLIISLAIVYCYFNPTKEKVIIKKYDNTIEITKK